MNAHQTNWCMGFNVPGFLPYSDPVVVGSWFVARDLLEDTLTAHRSEDLDAGYPFASYDRALDQCQAATPGADVEVWAGDHVYWIAPTPQRPR